MTTIAAKPFKLTPSIRAHVERRLAKFKALLPKSASPQVVLTEPVRKSFAVLCKVQAWGKEIVSHGEGANFHAALESARQAFARNIVDEKKRWIHRRGRPNK